MVDISQGYSVKCFIHVARTGGNFLLSGLYPIVEKNPSFRIFGLLPGVTRADLDGLFNNGPFTYIFHGHYTYGLHKLVQEIPVHYFTLIRDPVGRTISEFLWLIRLAKGADLMLVRDLAHRWVDSLLCGNHQCRYLARPFDERISESAHISMFDGLEGPIEADFEAAVKLLDAMSFVALSERLDDDFMAIVSALGMQLPPSARPSRRNYNMHGDVQAHLLEDAELMQKIVDKTLFDDRLYRHGETLREKHLLENYFGTLDSSSRPT